MKKAGKTIDFKELLHRADFKATPIRLALLRVLEKVRTPLAVGAIVKKLARISPDPVTVYRALKELKDAGIVRHIDLEHGHAHYELADRGDHHHLICVKCDRVEDFTGCTIEGVAQAALRQSTNFKTITRHSFELFGVCRTCVPKK